MWGHVRSPLWLLVFVCLGCSYGKTLQTASGYCEQYHNYFSAFLTQSQSHDEAWDWDHCWSLLDQCTVLFMCYLFFDGGADELSRWRLVDSGMIWVTLILGVTHGCLTLKWWHKCTWRGFTTSLTWSYKSCFLPLTHFLPLFFFFFLCYLSSIIVLLSIEYCCIVIPSLSWATCIFASSHP